MLIDPIEFLTIIILVVLAITLPIVLGYLIIVLRKADKLMDKFEEITNEASTMTERVSALTEDEDDMKEFIKDLTSYTVNDVIETQSNNIMQSVSRSLARIVTNVTMKRFG